MKTLGLFRHAKSDWGAPGRADGGRFGDGAGERDFDRGLNDRGRRGAALMGRHMRAHDVAWDMLLASPAQRVRATLEAARLPVAPEFDRRLYLAGAETLLDVVAEQAGDARAVLLAAHNPGLQDLILKLVAPAKQNALFDEACGKYPTATFAVIELAIDDWAQLGGADGELVHFKRPRDLAPDLGPED